MSAVKIYKDGKFIPFNLSNLVEVPIGTVDYVAYTELDANQLILDGSLVSRELYKDLWEWVQTKPSMLLTEEEWQSALTANEGLACNCYSTGDGSTTFRLPKESVIILPNPNPSNINKFSTDTQRNISGQFTSHQNGSLLTATNVNGAFSWSTNSISNLGEIGDGYGKNYPIYFDASRSVGTEHTGSEVKPKTITKLPVVYAFGSVYSSGSISIDELYEHIKTLEKSVGYPLGTIYPTLYSKVDVGSLPCLGGEYNRNTYKDLWDLVQTIDGYVVTEEEWQALNTANEGNVPKFSTGDGSTTFRVPKITKFLSGVSSISDVGAYQTDIQRNITGSYVQLGTSSAGGRGVLSFSMSGAYSSTDGASNNSIQRYSSNVAGITVDFDASRSVGTEHTGSEVAPKHIKVLYQVKAYGVLLNVGNIDVSDLAKDIVTNTTSINELKSITNIKTYTDLSQIGITKGTETLKAVGKALPDNSMLMYSIYPASGHNNVEYPYVSGQFRLIKSKNYCSLYFQTDFGRSYEKYFDDRDIYYVENSWKKIADKDKLSVPSNTKIAISLTNQGDSYTPSCDGLIWAKKSGTNSGSYMIISDTPEIENSTFGQVLYDDYGGQYVYNIQGCCTVAKNQTMYFFWNYNAIVNFIPFKNENYTLYGEDYRIYIKVTDADGNILKDANVKILSSSDTQIVSGTTSGDGRFFIPSAKLQELFNYISYTIEVTYGSATESLIYMRNQIDKEAINDIIISMSGITNGGGGNG